MLEPRQPITPTPYALHAANAANLMSIDAGPLDITVNGQRALRLEFTGPDAANLIGGYRNNSAAPGTEGVFVGGGGLNDGSDGDYPKRGPSAMGHGRLAHPPVVRTRCRA